MYVIPVRPVPRIDKRNDVDHHAVDPAHSSKVFYTDLYIFTATQR
jgi:hypothetical protein